MKNSIDGILGYLKNIENINNSIEKLAEFVNIENNSVLAPNYSPHCSPDFVFYDTTGILPVFENKGHFASLASVLSVENGYFGTRSCLEECYGDISTGATYIAGVYTVNKDMQTDKLAVMPDWTRVCIYINGEPVDLMEQKMLSHKRYFDIQAGMSVRELKIEDSSGRITSIRTEKFASLKDKHIAGQSISVIPENYSGHISIRAGIDGKVVNVDDAYFERKAQEGSIMFSVILPEKRFKDGEINPCRIVSMCRRNSVSVQCCKYSGYDGKYAFEEFDISAQKGEEIRINSVISIYANADIDNCVDTHALYCGASFENAIREHKSIVRQRLRETGITICGDETAQKFANYSIARLIMAGEHNGEKSSITARTLTGPSYAGHVFWDCEIFDLPFFTYTNPEKAKTMLMYRYNTLNGARKNREIESEEKKRDYRGARFAWESTSSGVERTPSSVINEKGQKVKILTGTHEKHITPDVAYATYEYWLATGDDEFLRKHGAEIIFDTARYVYSILEEGEDGKFHTKNVIGPDEYHEEYALNPLTDEKEGVNDNAYTNILIAHNLEIAVKTAGYIENNYPQDFLRLKELLCLDDWEIKDWIKAKNRIYVNQDEETGVIEQFEGFHGLKELDLEYFRRKYGEVNAQKFDQVVKAEHCCNPDFDPDKNNYKVLKQPDVVMLMALFPEKYSQAVQKANYEEYEPRTSHGSSLSVGIHSLVAARIGKTDDAYRYFLEAGGIDINDGMGNAANGIHAATLGATWQALVKGFGGMHLMESGLSIKPNLPDNWNAFSFNVQWHGQKLNVRTEKDVNGQEKMTITVSGENAGNVPVNLQQSDVTMLTPGNTYTAIKTDGFWKWESLARCDSSVINLFAEKLGLS